MSVPSTAISRVDGLAQQMQDQDVHFLDAGGAGHGHDERLIDLGRQRATVTALHQQDKVVTLDIELA